MKDLSEQTHYEVLEVAPGCAFDELAKAYAQAKDRYGPGSLATYALAEPGEAEALLRRVEEAFAVLADAEQRRTYDAARGFSTPGPPANGTQAPPVPEVQVPAAPVEVASPPEPPAEVAAVAPIPVAPELPEAPEPAPVPAPVPVVVAAPEPAPAPAVVVAPQAPELRSEPRAEPRAEPAAEHKPVRKTESDLPVDAAVTGDALRRVREARGLSLKDVEGRTKIGHWHLENIERERYADLPAQVYLRGFLMSFARELKLDPVRVARSYLEQMRVKSQPKPE